ncbi:hypothetical protein CC2G_014436 [Coprinopsis cinerea AmutBmut pab1-1]|nr:hypothetical protein CC2G_014436 [Coprinopsis cinerea AmutBmut pab1-1]
MTSFLKLYLAFSLLFLHVAAQTLTVKSARANGSGCPPGTAVVDVDNKNQKIKVRVQKFKAEAGPGLRISSSRRNCRVTLAVEVPEGYSFAAEKTVAKASYSAQSGVTLTSSSLAYFQGELEQGKGSTTVSGPTKGESTLTNEVSPRVWSPCGKDAILNLGTDLRVNNAGNRQRSGSISVDDVWEGTFVWRKC